MLTNEGLLLDGVIQVYRWERGIQRRFARLAARGARRLINVGYGLGFAQQVFELTSVPLDVIELNEDVARYARRHMRRGRLHLGSWERQLPELLARESSVFFDAFPVEPEFDYTARDFQRYIEPFLECLGSHRFRRAYFITFEERPITFKPPATLRVRRAISLALPVRDPCKHVTHASLYAVTPRSRRA
jgi:hypothetical protein